MLWLVGGMKLSLAIILIEIYFNVTKMLLKGYYGFICIVGLLKFCYCQQKNTQEKQFVVYFVEALPPTNYSDTWLCGGALVSPTQILTAAACLVKADNIYAIAGYKKFVGSNDIDNDECTKARKQRVVRILIPTEYKTIFKNPAQWIPDEAYVDVGVAIVEKPYNFSDLSYRTHCSYEPQPIFVNFENKYELTSTRAVAFGWSNPNLQPGDKTQLLQETSTVLVDKKVCSSIVNFQQLVYLIEKNLLCTSNNINDEKKVVEVSVTKDCQVRRYDLTKATDVDGCLEDDFGFRKHNVNDTEIYDTIKEISQKTFTKIKNRSNNENHNYTGTYSWRSSGSCQNGPGCPLIKWVDDKKIVIGVATYANKNHECSEPFLFVSTAAASKIIKCLLDTNVLTRNFCNQEINNKRYKVEEIEINWPGIAQQPQINVLPVKRAVSDDSSLIPRPTRDIYIVNRNIKSYNQAQKPEYKIDQPQSYDQNLHRILRESYEPPVQDADQVEPKPEQKYVSSLQQPSPLNQQYMQSSVKQYGPQSDQQYRVPLGQYEPPPEQEYELPTGQQYNPELSQAFDPQTGQKYEQHPGQQYESQSGQEFKLSVGHDYSHLSVQQYDPQSGLSLDAQGGQQYEPLSRHQYELPPGRPYESQPSAQYASPGLQPEQQYEALSSQKNEPPPSQKYEQPSEKRYRQQVGQYKTAPGSQYQQQQIQQQPPFEQYVSSQDQQYNESPSLFHRLQSHGPSQTELQNQLQTQLREQPQDEWQRQTQSQAQYQGNSQDMPEIQSQLQEQSQGHFQSQPLMRQLVDSEINSNVEVQLPSFQERPSQTSTAKTELQNENSSYLAVIQDPQTFDQIFSRLHNIPSEASRSNTPTREETFEQLFSHLHEPSYDLPHELTIPQYSSPPDEPYEENEQRAVKSSINRESEIQNGGTPSNGDLKVRPQMPMDYQNDYFYDSYRRNGSNS